MEKLLVIEVVEDEIFYYMLFDRKGKNVSHWLEENGGVLVEWIENIVNFIERESLVEAPTTQFYNAVELANEQELADLLSVRGYTYEVVSRFDITSL